MVKTIKNKLIWFLAVGMVFSMAFCGPVFADTDDAEQENTVESNIVTIQAEAPDEEQVIQKLPAQETEPQPSEQAPEQVAVKEEQAVRIQETVQEPVREEQEQQDVFSEEKAFEELKRIVREGAPENELNRFWENLAKEEETSLLLYIKAIGEEQTYGKYLPGYVVAEEIPEADAEKEPDGDLSDEEQLDEIAEAVPDEEDITDEDQEDSGTNGEAEEEAEKSASEDEGFEEAEDDIVADNIEAPEQTGANMDEHEEVLQQDSPETEESEQAEEPVLDKTVIISCDMPDVVRPGDKVLLTSQLINFGENDEIYYQWMVDKGYGFEEIEGANESVYERTITRDSLGWNYMLSVRTKIAE